MSGTSACSLRRLMGFSDENVPLKQWQTMCLPYD